MVKISDGHHDVACASMAAKELADDLVPSRGPAVPVV
jgi:hypothetical protein